LREDPGSINKRLDQWEFLQCTPLHWAACVQIEDVDGIHPLDPSKREELVELLLKKGADPNVVAGNGVTALDVAHAARATRIAALLERHGGRRAVNL
jgi:ankyrin repeat protein